MAQSTKEVERGAEKSFHAILDVGTVFSSCRESRHLAMATVTRELDVDKFVHPSHGSPLNLHHQNSVRPAVAEPAIPTRKRIWLIPFQHGDALTGFHEKLWDFWRWPVLDLLLHVKAVQRLV